MYKALAAQDMQAPRRGPRQRHDSRRSSIKVKQPEEKPWWVPANAAPASEDLAEPEESYTVGEVAGALGVHTVTVESWVRNQMLATDRGRVRPHHLRELCRRYPQAVNLATIERSGAREWFLSILLQPGETPSTQTPLAPARSFEQAANAPALLPGGMRRWDMQAPGRTPAERRQALRLFLEGVPPSETDARLVWYDKKGALWIVTRGQLAAAGQFLSMRSRRILAAWDEGTPHGRLAEVLHVTLADLQDDINGTLDALVPSVRVYRGAGEGTPTC